MSAEDHPSSFELESLHAGEDDPGVKRHADWCADCQAYLAQLTTERARFAAAHDSDAFVRRVRRRVDAGDLTSGEGARARPRPLTIAASAALSLMAAVLWVSFARPRGPTDEMRAKGGIQVAAIVLHGNAQIRTAGEIVGAPGDRFRVEVALTAPAVLDARVVDDRGRQVVLCEGRRLEAGIHYLEPTVAFDDSPTVARLLVGSADSRDIVVIPVRSEGRR